MADKPRRGPMLFDDGAVEIRYTECPCAMCDGAAQRITCLQIRVHVLGGPDIVRTIPAGTARTLAARITDPMSEVLLNE